MASTTPQLMDASNKEQILACVELVVEDHQAVLHSRERVDQFKATLRQLAHHSNAAVTATALWWLIFHVGENVAAFERAWKGFNSQRQ